MEELDLNKIVSQESFLNYCFRNNPDDVAYWENWLKENAEYTDQVTEIRNAILLVPEPAGRKVIDHDFQLLKNSIAKLNNVTPVRPVIKLWPRIAGVAVAVVVILSGIYLLNDRNNASVNSPNIHLANDIAPGKNVATLTLANGKTITLSGSKSGVVIKASALTYSDGTTIENIKVKGTEISTITTPRGGQYNIELPDGTTVALNAASTLKFPSSFSGLVNRRVELAGEGYFQVAPDKKHPFIVKSAGQTIQVLGTHFNINSYDDEPVIKTTLLEGSIKVSTYLKGTSVPSPGNTAILRPGEQAQLGDDGKLHTAEVNTKEVVAWKDGKFVFKDETLASIMRKISRWYNVDVIYQGINPEEPFWGSISKFENVSKVLEKLELTGGVHFKIEGKKIYVTR